MRNNFLWRDMIWLKKKSDLFFLYGFEGIGKNFIWNIIYVVICGLDKIIINIVF